MAAIAYLSPILALGMSLATFVVGYYVFKKMEPFFADSI